MNQEIPFDMSISVPYENKKYHVFFWFGNPISQCVIREATSRYLCSYGISVRKNGDKYSPEKAARYALASALRKSNFSKAEKKAIWDAFFSFTPYRKEFDHVQKETA